MEKIGKFFKEFTPFMYIKYEKTTEGVRANFFDLRYFIKNRFLHNGTVTLNNEMEPVEAAFHPYSPNRNITIP